MGKSDFYADGDWNALCNECGQKYKFSKLKETWDGRWTCPRCFELRHPQDFVKGVMDNQTPPHTLPEPPDRFTEGAEELPVPESNT